MNINSLNRRVDIYGKISATNELDETTYKYGKIGTVWSSIVPQTGKLQTQQANSILSNVTHKIIIRYESGKSITQDMYLLYEGHRFDINYILNPYFKNETLEIFCQEVRE